MEGRRVSPTKTTMVPTVQGKPQRDATTTDTNHDARYNVGGSTQPNEQHAMDKLHESMATTGEQGVLTIRGEG